MFRRKPRQFIAVPDHHRRKVMLLRPPGILPRKTLLVMLATITLLGLAFYAEVSAKPKTGLQEESPGAKIGALVGQGKVAHGPDSENASGPEQECPDAEAVWEGLGKGDLETDLFETRTDRFIVSYDLLQLPKKDMPNLYATVEDERGRTISGGHIPSPRPGEPVRSDLTPDMGRAVVDAGPGSYRVAISPSDPNRRYAVLVEECGGTTTVT